MSLESHWDDVLSQVERRSVSALSLAQITTSPGVYIWFWEGEPAYLGKATSLRDRLGRHLKKDLDLSRSAFRRNVAEHIGVATVAECRIRPSVLTEATVAKVNEWIGTCELLCVNCDSAAAARMLEKELLGSWKAFLNRAS